MKAIEPGAARPAGASEDAPQIQGLPVHAVTPEIVADASRFAGYMRQGVADGLATPPKHARKADAPAPGAKAQAGELPSSSMPSIPSVAHVDRQTPVGTERAQGLPSRTQGPAAQTSDGPAQKPGAAPAARVSDRAAFTPDHATPKAHTGPGPVLSPNQLQARAIKRKALGLDGGLHGPAHQTDAKAAHRAPAAHNVGDKQAALDATAASAAMPQQPLHRTPAPASTPATGNAVPQAAVRGADRQPAEVQDVRAPQATATAMPSNQSSNRVNVASTATAATLASTANLAASAAPVLEQHGDAAPAEERDLSDARPTDESGAPAAPVRYARQERVAEEIGAQIAAQQVQLAVANTPPIDSSPLQEVLKKV